MRTVKTLPIVLVILLFLSLNIFAADSVSITADTATKGDWVGKYGSDGYFLFAGSVDECVNKLPAYVSEFTYSDLFGEEPSFYQWWSGDGSDTSGIGDANTIEDALWTDATKTQRFIPCIYNGNGLDLTIDVGTTKTNVSIYSCDWGNDGRCVNVTAYDSDGNTLGTYDLKAFEHGTYLTATITGKVVFEYSYYDAVNLGSASNAVISGVFFDTASSGGTTAAAETEPAAVDTAIPETTAEIKAATDADTAAAAAPQTSDMTLMIISGIIVTLGAAYVLRKK
jgi:hypothetical protein